MYVIKEPEENSFEKVGIKGSIFPISHLTNKTEFVVLETNHGHKTTILQKESDFVYYILEGEGQFIIEGAIEPCRKGDLVVVPAGKQFRYEGSLKMLLSVTPPWKEEQEETIHE